MAGSRGPRVPHLWTPDGLCCTFISAKCHCDRSPNPHLVFQYPPPSDREQKRSGEGQSGLAVCSYLTELEEDARSALEDLERTALLQTLRQAVGAEAGEGLGEADPSTDTPDPRESLRKAFSGQDSNTVLSRLLARTRKQHKQHRTASECFWKYCI
ncbi:urotensin-2 isoform X1 [Psammomys obesus]|uniref:urotensin-2 isoform X1 n=1 Tax=Psammomys obesus TaxID=48139 RepID=UPI0024537003|nr:urotensin-2 isoform X1 [Psammomys obesus]